MLPYTPILASRVRPRRAIAAALCLGLGLGLGLVVAAMLRVSPGPAVSMPCPVEVIPSTYRLPAPDAIPIAPTAVVPVAPSANAADLVGIYGSSACTLTLDASGTYVSDCGHGRRARHVRGARYTIAGEDVVLEQPSGDDEQRLTISARGRLVAADGTVYSITGGAR